MPSQLGRAAAALQASPMALYPWFAYRLDSIGPDKAYLRLGIHTDACLRRQPGSLSFRHGRFASKPSRKETKIHA